MKPEKMITVVSLLSLLAVHVSSVHVTASAIKNLVVVEIPRRARIFLLLLLLLAFISIKEVSAFDFIIPNTYMYVPTTCNHHHHRHHHHHHHHHRISSPIIPSVRYRTLLLAPSTSSSSSSSSSSLSISSTSSSLISSNQKYSNNRLYSSGNNNADSILSSSNSATATDNIVPTSSFVEPDYMVYDTINTTNISAVQEFLLRPRNVLVMILIAICGFAVMIYNILGNYDSSYIVLEDYVFILALLNGITDVYDSIIYPSKYNNNNNNKNPNVDPRIYVSPNIRCGVVDDAVLYAYSGVYTIFTAWLGYRTSPLCPSFVPKFDIIVGPVAASIFLFSLLAPILTLLFHYCDIGSSPLKFLVKFVRQQNPQLDLKLPKLSSIELLRATSLLAIGVVGCIYTPMVISLTIKGSDWWTRVCEQYPGQSTVEPSTAMFGILATQASMLSHRGGKAGVAPVRVIVPIFTLVCIFLAVLPCACLLYWLSDQITFFSLYSM